MNIIHNKNISVDHLILSSNSEDIQYNSDIGLGSVTELMMWISVRTNGILAE